MRKALAPLLAIPLLLAQQQPPAGVPSIKFTADSQLVVETVSVKDKNGNPIEGLTAKDFVVTENGVPQEIKFCEFQRIDNTPAGPVQAPTIADVAKAAAPPNVTAVQITPEAPGDIKYRDRRLLAIYFDMSAMPIPDQLRALDAAQKLIKTKMAKADLMALMKYHAGAVKVLQDFTDDRDQLLKVIGDLIVGEAQGLDENAADASAADTGAAFGQDDSEFNLFNTDRQLAALQTAIRMLGNLNEKKALVYFASGMRLNGADNQAQMRATVNSAIRANVSLWPVDARGLVALPPGEPRVASPSGGSATRPRASTGHSETLARIAEFTVARICAWLSTPLRCMPLAKYTSAFFSLRLPSMRMAVWSAASWRSVLNRLNSESSWPKAAPVSAALASAAFSSRPCASPTIRSPMTLRSWSRSSVKSCSTFTAPASYFISAIRSALAILVLMNFCAASSARSWSGIGMADISK